MATTHESTLRKPLRLWPGVVAAVLIVLLRGVVAPLAADARLFGMPVAMLALFGSIACALVIVLWWTFFSRVRWSERLAALVVIIVAIPVVRLLVDESIRGAAMGYMYFFNALLTVAVGLVAWAAASRRLSGSLRHASMVASILVACGVWALVRTGGITGEGASDLHWRWTPTPEEKLLAQTRDEVRPPAAATPAPAAAPAATPPAPAAPEKTAAAEPAPSAPAADRPTPADPVKRNPEWPGFRGPARDGAVRGVRVETDWARTPPSELWRKPVGPGWSSFAVSGDYIYTQEQRGDDEVVSCYRLSTGEPVWRHRDPVRFYESNGGPGPRATPTVSGGRVFTLGATGIANALDATTGARLWTRNAAADTGAALPDWGFAGSPLVVNDVAIFALSGTLIAYDVATGRQRWLGPQGGAGYSSPHLLTIDGIPQIVLLRGRRTTSVSPDDGSVLWEHGWQPSASIVQPSVLGNGDILINTADAMGGQGMRRLAIVRSSSGWSVEERWTSRGLKPYFNDYVVHKGHAYGFDGSILSCINVDDGERKWKGGRYGHGQMLLLPDQDLLLVLSEDGELALVKATPDQHTEIARFKAIEGKTWNHPVLTGNLLLVRNGEEMAAIRLPVTGS